MTFFQNNSQNHGTVIWPDEFRHQFYLYKTNYKKLFYEVSLNPECDKHWNVEIQVISVPFKTWLSLRYSSICIRVHAFQYDLILRIKYRIYLLWRHFNFSFILRNHTALQRKRQSLQNKEALFLWFQTFLLIDDLVLTHLIIQYI